ncbi:Alpha/Beta hydrolase protein [Kickxella alabastrina]|uniref:Alpha/Beta hydrolase protein n=1 Tax=Kickxella alabastrina TaxID=61397 RepID=UPI00221FFDDA|nr:Alpha/Beta hydrolase protein [Kickxella alabastrina]KAI7823664.1 Alpha/Beta hydrolase protein [Kickxella alabastrina]
MKILKRAKFVASIARSAAKSTISYCVKGPRCERWPLKLQVLRDVIYSISKIGNGASMTDDDIDLIDFEELAASYKKHDLPDSEIPFHLGTAIDPELFVGTGPAEKGLIALIKTCNPYELTAPTPLPGSAELAAKCEPLTPNERIILYLHAAQAGLRCFTIDYRLAPLHPYPAQLHDAYISFHFLLQQGFRAENIVLAGDSAGGNLVLALTLLLKHTGIPHVRGLVLLSPWTDIISQRPSIERNKRFDYLVNMPMTSPMSRARLFYAPGRRMSPELMAEMAHPLVSPVNADFSDFPPTLIQAGDKELLLDEISELFHNILAANPDRQDIYTYECYADMIHVFHQSYH